MVNYLWYPKKRTKERLMTFAVARLTSKGIRKVNYTELTMVNKSDCSRINNDAIIYRGIICH